MARYNQNRYQYETSPRKLQPEYRPTKKQYPKKSTAKKNNVKSVAFIIGPEGGFDLREIEKLKQAGIDTITLGKRILRTETAGEAVLSMVMAVVMVLPEPRSS